MNPVKQIGRYMLPLGSVVGIKERPAKIGLRKLLFWRAPGFDVLLSNGRTIHFTEEERQAYEDAVGWHEVTLHWFGAARGAGLRA